MNASARLSALPRAPSSRASAPLCVLASRLRRLGACALLALAAPSLMAQESPLTGQSLVVIPGNVLALQKVHAALRLGHREEALTDINEALAQYPDDLQLRFTKAVLLTDLGRTDEAITVLEALSSQFPELPEPYNNLAVIRAAQGRQADAERLLKQAIATQSNYLTARENLADLHIGMAVTAYNEALKLDPHNEALLKKRNQAQDLANRIAPAKPARTTQTTPTPAGAAKP